ncbi:MAG: conserved phage C-terminal domain-containing protein [Deltaproteobacteria bacterium]|nr:conserved phage C-terminal domain-containing protein [Deltaproteobacteria bacterium]
MDWSNEKYVRLYVRDTDSWLSWSWQARALFCLMLRKVDRAGVLETKRGARGVTAHTGMPFEVVTEALRELLEDGCVREHGDGRGYVMPNFLEAQEAAQSDRLRAREYRARRRDHAAGVITERDASDTKRDGAITERDENVTRRHAASLLPSLPSQTKNTKRPASHALAPEAVELARIAVDEINRVTGRAFDGTSRQTIKLAAALVKAGHTPDEARAVIAAKAAEWLPTEKMARHVCPSTLLALSNFEKYIEEAKAGPVRQTTGDAPSPSRTVPESLFATDEPDADGGYSW